MYECSCGKQYKRLKPFHIHRASCELLRLSKKSNQDISHLSNLPSQQEMWLAQLTLNNSVVKTQNYFLIIR